MQPNKGPSNSIAAYLEEICTRHEAEKAAVAEKMRLKEERQARRKCGIAKDSGDRLAGRSMITRSSRRDTGTGEIVVRDVDEVPGSEEDQTGSVQQDDGDLVRIKPRTRQRGRSPVKDTGTEPTVLPSPRLRPRAVSCPPIPQRSDTVVRFPRELTAMAVTRGPAGATRELTREDSIEAAMPPRQERHVRKRPAPAPESTDIAVDPSASSVAHGFATHALKRPRFDSAAGTSGAAELLSRRPPSPSLSSSTLTPPPPELPQTEACSHCRSTVEPHPRWRTSVLEPGRKICKACWMYEWKNRKPRPLVLETKRSQRGVKKCAHCGVTTSSLWRFSKLEPGRKLCSKCADYERRHGKVRPPALFQP
ncbi:hypothetical protein DFH06DRAFT_1101154 [Mycena polygramma]|nr:hypothetical protein DFH06DRAFT_1101154 [Mycena polygramma]